MSKKLAAKPGIELPRLSSREAHGKRRNTKGIGQSVDSNPGVFGMIDNAQH